MATVEGVRAVARGRGGRHKVVSVSSSRADVGILTPVWEALLDRGFDLHVFLTGMHRRDGCAQIAVPARAERHVGGCDLAGRDGGEASLAMASIAHDAAALCGAVRPDAVVVIGDRLDMLPAATATLAYNTPLLHLHGGELTYGSVDERTRHALTKLAHLHAVATVAAADRVVRMGEEPWRVRVVGAPGLDSLRRTPPMPRDDFACAIGFDDIAGLRLVTVHPESNAADPLAPFRATLAALDKSPRPTLFTAPNSDPGGDEIKRRIASFVADRPWARYIDTLGGMFSSALEHAEVMVGNSSSGVIEAGMFGLPVINVGRRQEGRERGRNVLDCISDPESVGAALRCMSGERFPRETPYGDGRSGGKVAEFLAENLVRGPALLAKRFYEEPRSQEAA